MCSHKSSLIVTTLSSCLAAALVVSSASAALVSSSDLFLAPSSVGLSSYEFHQLEGLDGSSGLVRAYSSSDVGGATIVGVKILPLLNPNSANIQGEYSTAELAAINSGNYASFYFAQPNQDYYADLSAGLLSVEYYAAGTYFLEVTAERAGVSFTKIFEDDVDDFQGSLPGAPRDPTKAGRVIASPTADLSLVSNSTKEPAGTNGYSSAAFKTLQTEGKNPKLANSVADVISQIQAACKAKGAPISVTLVGHGASGAVQIGSTLITTKPRAGTTDMTPADFQKAIDKDPTGKRCVKAIDFYSCNVNTNSAGMTEGTDFMKAMQDSIKDTRAFNQYTTAMAPYTVFNRRTGKTVIQRAGYFDVGAGGVLGSLDIAEPTMPALLLAGWAAMLALRRARKNTAHAGGKLGMGIA